ncbi:hypothetical protein BSKO_09171 [Bryopsis sp. KO-2023]|nr:hypothetical protein BSKO_09171 [Bryopsis sp. KO-2023]
MSNGCAVELTQGCRVSVDYWNRKEKFQACFLTHAHTDHTKGLSDRWPGPDIHCTEETKRFILNKWPGLEEKIVTVTVGDAVDLCLTSRNEERLCVTVTPIDARHCPGSVMFLFEGSFGRILHTGDFRWELEDGCMEVPDVLLTGPIDRLYLDNTYCNPEYKFPPRSSEIKRIVDIVKHNPEFKVVIGMDSLGKEELVEVVSRVAEEAVGVSESRVGALRIAGIPEECFTTDKENARITVIPKWTVRQDDLASTTPPSIGIVPTALFSQPYRYPTKVPTNSWRKQQLRVTVPYSLHCCFVEIEAFVSILQPREIIGIVKTSRGSDINPLSHFRHLLAGAGGVAEADLTNPFERVCRGQDGEFPKSMECPHDRNPSTVRRHSSEPIPRTPVSSLEKMPPSFERSRNSDDTLHQQGGNIIDLSQSPVGEERSKKSEGVDVGVRRAFSEEEIKVGVAVGLLESGGRGVKMGGAGVVSTRSWRTRFTRPQRSALKIVPQGCVKENKKEEKNFDGCARNDGVSHEGVKQETISTGGGGVMVEQKEELRALHEEEKKEEEEEIVPNPHKLVWSATDERKYCKEAINVEC